jgi:exopolysaccharide biosynthesis protein
MILALSGAALGLLAAATFHEARAAGSGFLKSEPGLSYTNIKVASEPWSIHVLKIDRTQKDLAFYSAHAKDRVLGVSLVADQARAVPSEIGRTLAAVNGDFYVRDNPTYGGDPRGLQIINGDLISGPDTVCTWFDTEGNPHLDEVKGDFKVTWPDGSKTSFGLNQQRRPNMSVLYTPSYGPSTRAARGRELILEKDGDSPWLPLQAGQTYRARVREISTNGNTRLVPDVVVLSLGPQVPGTIPDPPPGTVLQISTATAPDLKGVKTAIGGGPALIRDKKLFDLFDPPRGTSSDFSQRSKYERHPRSAVGWSATHVYFVTVDGRQPGLSVGMKLAELAEFMSKLGCTDAMNLDGGKSAQLWISGRIVNSPCQGEDTVANSLLVVRKPEPRGAADP